MFLTSGTITGTPQTPSQLSLASSTTSVTGSKSEQLLFSFYILKRQHVIYACRWNATTVEDEERRKPKKTSYDSQKGDQKLLSGLLFSIKTFCQKLAPMSIKGPSHPSGSLFTSFTTPFYKLHYFESATGYKFVMTTSPSVADIKDFLKSFYIELFVPFVLRAPTAASNLVNPIRPNAFSPLLQEFVEKKLQNLVRTTNGNLLLEQL